MTKVFTPKGLPVELAMDFNAFIDAVVTFCKQQQEHNSEVYELLRLAKGVLEDHEARICNLEILDSTPVDVPMAIVDKKKGGNGGYH